MRKRFDPQMDLGQTPIDKVIIPLKSRYQLPPPSSPAFHGSSAPPGCMKPFLRCWRLDCDYDHIEHIANSDGLVREIMGLPAFGTRPGFHHRTIRDNICLVDEALLTEINALVVQLGLPILKKNAAENRAQVAGNRRCRPPGQAPAPAKPNLRPP